MEFTRNETLAKLLQQLYTSPDEVDLLVGQELDPEHWPNTLIPRSQLAISFLTLFKGAAIDRFSLQYAFSGCFVEEKPWNCHPKNYLQDLLWKKTTVLGHEWRVPDAHWMTEFDLQEQGVNILRRLVAQNTEIKCMQKNLYFHYHAKEYDNPRLCWDLSAIPGPKGMSGNSAVQLAQLVTQNVKYWDNLYHEYGYIVHYRLPGQDFILLSRINDVNHIFHGGGFNSRPALDFFGETYGRMAGLEAHRRADGLTSAVGAGWKLRRDIANEKIVPKLRNAIPELLPFVKDVLEKIKQNEGQPWDPYDAIRRSIFDWGATAGYGTGWTKQKQDFKDKIYKCFKTWIGAFPFDTPISFELHRALDTIANWQAPLLRHREEVGAWEDDWLSIFATTEIDGKKLNEAQTLATTIDFLAGANTAAMQNVYGLYLLSKNPAVCNRIREELHKVLKGGPITTSNVHQLTYLAATVKEISRYESGGGRVGLGRTNTKTEVLETYQLDTGVNVLLNVYSIHHNKRYYSEPDKFNPDRWLTGPFPPKEAYLSFGAGVRECPGKDVSNTIAMLQYAEILRLYKFTTESAFQPQQGLGGQLKTPLEFTFELLSGGTPKPTKPKKPTNPPKIEL